MTFFENLKLALQNFAHSKLRTSLSALGIIIGVMSVIAITTLGGSATDSIQDSIVGAGLNSITVFAGRSAPDSVVRTFDMEFADRIAEEVEGVAAAVPLVSSNFTLSYGKNQLENVRVMATSPEYAGIYQYPVAEGVFLNDENDRRRESVAVLGAEIAETLFPDGDALGKRVRIFRNQARSFKVIGVMESMADSMGNSFDSQVYVPVSTYDSRLQKIQSVGSYGVTAETGSDVLEVSANLEDWFTEIFGEEGAVRVMSPAGMADMFSGITQTMNLFLSGVAAISLLVGGIGIMNIMLVSVSERTREIGIRKALGATPRVIRRQFLFEAASLTTIGGIIGVIGGLGLSAMGINALGWTFSLNLPAVIAAVIFSTVVGIFFGLYPAARASKLDPVEALAYQ
jgi:putative ABC transport system permease protein